jgi:alkylated DNA repair dioxygenase AlkB
MDQFDLFEFNQNEETTILKNGEYLYIPNFFPKSDADRYFKAFIKDIMWKQEEMQMYGKIIKFPRLTAWYGDNDKPYSFSGLTLSPLPWTLGLLEIKKLIEPKSDAVFNSVLLNRYRDGNDSISWHTDAEKELGINPVIASVNLGAERKFQLKHKENGDKVEIILQHGSLLVMKGELQHYWQHQVPKTKITVGERINLTFRVIK